MNELAKNVILWVVIAIVLLSVFNNFAPNQQSRTSTIEYSQFLDYVESGMVDSVV
ncbi:MAG: ATP-dependent metallopeptidase FtsH/Yme1/Tma family protein, partial [Gammaproteobacteria bacterium]|nr:ATP-dependent metallopeptidase FtsH/Yme1/Tma family protein [Gammaproteobacteria bacterium]